MDIWTKYNARISAKGKDRRESTLRREKEFLSRKLPSSLSYHSVILEGEEREMAVINSDHKDIKTICSLPDEDFRHGGLVRWMENYWLITERDANNEIYTKGTMRQCNYLLRWIDADGGIQERWCIIDDGTKYLTGERTDNNFIITYGDSRVALIITKDEHTVKFTRDMRFLIDDYASGSVLAYRLTKPYKLGGSYGDDGVLSFVLAECNTEDDDNLELHIADYYSHFPKEGENGEGTKSDESEDNADKASTEKKVWF